LKYLARALHSNEKFDAAEEAASRALNLLSEKGEEHRVCESHRTLGNIYQSRGEIEKAIHHFELALGIASIFNWHGLLFWIHYELTGLFWNEDRSDDAHAHIERAEPHTVNNALNLGRAMELQARVWYDQHRLEEAKPAALRGAQVYEKLGAANDVNDCRELLRDIEKELNTPVRFG
jgi:tetratricopeptide (TPR) repeat protein